MWATEWVLVNLGRKMIRLTSEDLINNSCFAAHTITPFRYQASSKSSPNIRVRQVYEYGESHYHLTLCIWLWVTFQAWRATGPIHFSTEKNHYYCIHQTGLFLSQCFYWHIWKENYSYQHKISKRVLRSSSAL